MATDKELVDEVNDYWIGWDGRGDNPVEYDLEHGPMRKKMRDFIERKKVTDQRTAEFDEVRNKYKRREK
ncbi:hypothetical protein VPHK567_0165 [Vibrio phage K567]